MEDTPFGWILGRCSWIWIICRLNLTRRRSMGRIRWVPLIRSYLTLVLGYWFGVLTLMRLLGVLFLVKWWTRASPRLSSFGILSRPIVVRTRSWTVFLLFRRLLRNAFVSLVWRSRRSFPLGRICRCFRWTLSLSRFRNRFRRTRRLLILISLFPFVVRVRLFGRSIGRFILK